MKRITAVVLFLFCILCILSVSSNINSSRDFQGSLPQPDTDNQIPLQLPSVQTPVEQTPSNETIVSDVMIYEAGQYEVGVDIPVGIYMAINDGSRVSKVTITDTPEPISNKPKIIITNQYSVNRTTFIDREVYVEAIRRGGGEPILPENDEDLVKIMRDGSIEYADVLAERYDGLLLTGGGDIASHFFNQEHHPASNPPDETLDKVELALCLAFIQAKKPVLGICRGMQIQNVALGGDLIQDIPDLLGLDLKVHHDDQVRHTIKNKTGSWMYELFGSQVDVNSTHHQAVGVIAPGFTVVSQIGPVVEAMEFGNILGVQFHPERMVDEGMLPLFDDFVKRCSYGKIEINIFSTHSILEFEENQYVQLSGATLQQIEDTYGKFEAIYKIDGYYPEGVYLVGHHIPEGEYKLAVTESPEFSYFAVYEDAAQKTLLNSGIIPADGNNITLKTGQFIKLIYVKMTPVSEH